MLSHEIYLLVTCLLITLATAIRVDWNTNQGPIVPPTPRTTVRPQPPFREPAPVWEDQRNDVPNTNSYVYVLPPPSRPRPATNNYLTFDRRPATFNNNNYGNIVAPSDVNSYLQNGNGNVVASLSPKYVPNVGVKYAAVVPNGKKYTNTNNNGLSSGYGDKVQGKYNAKTKKYKAYEKVKYNVPLNYYPMFELTLPGDQKYVPEFDSQQVLQQLPLPQAPQPFKAAESVKQQEEQQQQQQLKPAKLAHDKDVGDKSKNLSLKPTTKKQQSSTPNKFTSTNAIFSPSTTKKSS